ncbi:BMP-binding endothelial regulator protein-like, partial [Saccoglossus kowalevskii]
RGSAEITFTVVETGLTQTLAVVGLYAEESFLLDDILQDYHIDWYDTARPSYKSSILVNKCGTVDRDPHVTTFDGVKYEFQGPCTYVLTQDCSDINNPLFQITADFRGKYSELKSKYLTRIDAVNININGNQIVRILKDNTFLINGKLTKSYTVIGDNDGTVDIKDGHPTVTLYKVGLSLTWLKETSAVDISFTGSEMRGNVCGLLGNNNGNPDDDLMTPNGNIVSDVYEFGESWTVPGSCLVP